ncbi:MAG: PQQ-binding-like beta-propeller repeat protein [Candidatus Kuenenia sp.]|nr:PQQ-binding-like beta-propeller repeat protein [Candidatus Kuenenia hertensis]
MFIFLSALHPVLLHAQLANSPWPMFMHDIQHTGQNKDNNGPVQNVLLWKYQTQDEFVSSPVLGEDGAIYIGNIGGEFFSITPNGTRNWVYECGDIYSTATVDINGTIYFGSDDGYFYALDEDGGLKWRFLANQSISSSPVINPQNGVLYFGDEGNYLYVLDTNGNLLQQKKLSDEIWSPLAIDSSGKILFVGTLDGLFYAINADTLETLWSFNTDDFISGSPVIDEENEQVIFVSEEGVIFCRDKNNGSSKWSVVTGKDFEESALALDILSGSNTIYALSTYGTLYALARTTGVLKWTYETGNLITAPAIDRDGVIYFGSADKNVYAINSDGTLRWTYKAEAEIFGPPCIGENSVLYIGGARGNVYAIGLSPDIPKADFTAEPTTGEAPLNVKFTDTSAGEISSWLWDFGDGVTDTTQNPTHTYNEAGTFTVSLTVVGTEGSNTKTVDNFISVTDKLTADFEAVPASGEWPLVVQFTDKSTGEIIDWLWDFGDGNTDTTQNPIHIYSAVGSYTVSLTVSDIDSSVTKTIDNYISVYQRESAVEIDLSSNEITFGESLSIIGRITPSIQSDVVLTFTKSNGETDMETVTSNGAGVFTLSNYYPSSGGAWTVTANWNGNDNYKGAGSNELSFTVNQTSVALTIESSSATVQIDQTVDISGIITLTPENEVTGGAFVQQNLKLIRINPENEYEDVFETQPFLSDDQLRYNFSGISLPALGTWELLTGFDETESFIGTQTASREIEVQPAPKEVSGYAIIVEGKVKGGSGLDSHNLTTNYIYNKLIERGFTDDGIQYFNYDVKQEGVDKKPSHEEIENTIRTWASEKMNSAPAPLYIFLVGHGKKEKFPIYSGESLTVSDLSYALDSLESSLGTEALEEPIVIVIGTNRSGSFINKLSRTDSKRIIITSCDSEEIAYKGPLAPDETLRHGDFFVVELMNALSNGKTIKKSHENAAEKIAEYTENENGNGLDGASAGNRHYFDEYAQHPLLDDNGDGIGTYGILSSSDNEDGGLSVNIIMGVGTETDTIEFTDSMDTVTIELEDVGPTVVAEVKDISVVDEAWVEIAEPGHKLKNKEDTTEQQEIDLHRFSYNEVDEVENEFIWNDFSKNKELDNFSEPGEYEVFYFAREIGTDDVSLFMESDVIRNKAENQPPTPFNPVFPTNGTDTAVALTFDWEESTDPDSDEPVTYTLTVSTDGGFDSIYYQEKGIEDSYAVVDKKASLRDSTTYYWKVLASDVDGGTTLMGENGTNSSSRKIASSSETESVSSFTAKLSNGYPGFIKGIVFDSDTSAELGGSTVQVKDIEGSYTTTDSGAYVMELDSGEYSVSAQMSGYVKNTETAKVNALATTKKDIGLEVDPKSSSVSGMATDKKTGDPLEGVTITIKKKGLKEEITSNTEGMYSFTGLESGKYKMIAKKSGYKKYRKKKIKLKTNQEVTQNLKLKSKKKK